MHAAGEEESEVNEDTVDNEQKLHAWCLLDESEHEQRQEVISRRDTQRLKNTAHVSLLSVGNKQGSTSKNKVQVKGKCVKVRVTIGSWSCRTCHD